MSKKPVTPKKPLIPDHVKKKARIATFIALGAILTEGAGSIYHDLDKRHDMGEDAVSMTQQDKCSAYAAGYYNDVFNQTIKHHTLPLQVVGQMAPVDWLGALKLVAGKETEVSKAADKLNQLKADGYHFCINIRMEQTTYVDHKKKTISFNSSHPDYMIQKHAAAMLKYLVTSKGDLTHDVMTWPQQKSKPKVVAPNVPPVAVNKSMKHG